MSEYIYLIHPYRGEFFENPTPHEQAVMTAHFEYLNQAKAQGVIILAGSCQDESFNLVVFKADDEENARAFMMNDPVVCSDVMMAELHPIKVSLRGGC